MSQDQTTLLGSSQAVRPMPAAGDDDEDDDSSAVANARAMFKTATQPESKDMANRTWAAKSCWALVYMVIACNALYAIFMYSGAEEALEASRPCVSAGTNCSSPASACCDSADHCIAPALSRPSALACGSCPVPGAICINDFGCCPRHPHAPTSCVDGQCQRIPAPPANWRPAYWPAIGWATCQNAPAQCTGARVRDLADVLDDAAPPEYTPDGRYRGPFVVWDTARDTGCHIPDEDLCGLGYMPQRAAPGAVVLRRDAL